MRISTHTLVYCKDNSEDSGISIIKKLLVTLNQRGWGMSSVWSHLYGANYFCHTGMDLCVESVFLQVSKFGPSFTVNPNFPLLQTTSTFHLEYCEDSYLISLPLASFHSI